MGEWTKERHEAAKALYSDEPELHVGAYCEEGDYFPICDRGNEVGRAITMRVASVFANASTDAVDMLAKIEALTAERDAWKATAKAEHAIRRAKNDGDGHANFEASRDLASARSALRKLGVAAED